MTSLQQDLPALAALASEVQAQTAALVAEGKDVERAANELLEHIGEQRSQAADLFAQALQALEGLQSAARERETALGDDLDQTVEGIGQSLERLGSIRDELAGDVEGAQSAMGDLREELEQARSSTRSAATACGDAVAAADGATDRIRDELEETLDTADAEMEALRHAVRRAQDVVREGLAALRDRMRGLLEDGRREVESTEQTLRASLGELQSHLSEQKGRLTQGSQELLEELQQHIDSGVKARIADAVDSVLAKLGPLGQATAEAESEAHREGEELESRIQVLGEAMEPLPAAIASVREAAKQVGLPWG